MKKFWIAMLLPLAALSCHSSAKPQSEGVNSTVRKVVSKDGKQVSENGEVGSTSGEQNPVRKDDILKRTLYSKEDSAQVVRLLQQNPGREDVLFYARQFLGVPYVAATLEQRDPEQLVVNLRELDCTTLVETTLALTLTKRQGGDSFADFCRNLESLRYWNGEMDGYLSRLHYFTWWKRDNEKRGHITEVTDKKNFTATINVQNHYMSAHPEKYKFLKAHPEWLDSIAAMEKAYNGSDGHYLPAEKVGLSRAELRSIENGDLVAIVTRKDGLDYSHLGFAVWGKDGCLHLLNASSLHHKVVEEPKTLRQYLREQRHTLGIRLWRLQ